MKETKNRSEIEETYKWDLTSMISNDLEVEKLYKSIENLSNEVVTYKGHIMDSSETLYNFFKLINELNRIHENLYVYSNMLCDQDTTNIENQTRKARIDKLGEIVNEKMSFILPELLESSYDVVQTYIEENKELELYRFELEKTFRYKNHVLSKEEEEIVTQASNAMGTGSDAFYNLDNADIHYGTIQDENGKEIELTNSNYISFMNSLNREVRKNAFEKMYIFWEKHKNTTASLLKGQIKENFFDSKVHKYNSPLEESLFSDNIEKKVYTNLIDTIHKHLDKFHRYMRVKRDALEVDQLHMYDIYVELVKEKPKEIPFEEGKDIMFEALKPLGKQYIEDAKKAFIERWVDVYPNKGKKSGAYSWGSYDSYPYLLLNYSNNSDSVSTMAHELGHSMHSYYSIKNQDYLYYQYPIFLAEIASNVNEMLLDDYLYKTATTDDERKLYLSSFLDKFRGSIFRQVQFAEFEMLMHDKEEQGIPLTEEEFSSTYYELNKLYYGDDVVSDELIRYEWERIPHFYTSFYVYKYATGLAAAIAIVSKLLEGDEGFRDKYLEFLSSGGSDYPLDILKKLGIDMTTSEAIEKAMEMFDNKLNELIKLV